VLSGFVVRVFCLHGCSMFVCVVWFAVGHCVQQKMHLCLKLHMVGNAPPRPAMCNNNKKQKQKHTEQKRGQYVRLNAATHHPQPPASLTWVQWGLQHGSHAVLEWGGA